MSSKSDQLELGFSIYLMYVTIYLIKIRLTFLNSTDPDQAALALIRAA